MSDECLGKGGVLIYLSEKPFGNTGLHNPDGCKFRQGCADLNLTD